LDNAPKNILITIISIALVLVMLAFMSIWIYVPIIELYRRTVYTETLRDPMFFLEMYKNPKECFTAFKQPYVTKNWFILYIATLFTITILVFVFLKRDQTVNYKQDDGTHGTATWMSAQTAKNVLGVGLNKGIIFGKMAEGGLLGLIKPKPIVTLPPKTYFNRNVAIFGASGSMKSRAYVRNNILQMASEGHSIIVTDPKGELFQDTSLFLESRGYNVKAYNLSNMQHSDRWNPIAEVKNDIDAQLFAEVVIANTKMPGSKGSDPFWDRGEQNLLKALVMFVVNEYPEGERNLPSVYSLLASSSPKHVDKIFSGLPLNHPAKMPYNIYAQANETVRTGIIIGLGTRLQVFQNNLVQQLAETSDMDLTLPGQEKCAYFAIVPDTDSTFDFLAGLFFSFLFINLTRYADLNGGKCDKEVYFLLDEFPNIGAIPDFTKKISTIRSRGIHSSVIFQNIAQLKNRYPNDAWQEIIGNCDSRLFLGATDYATAQFVSDLLGQSTVEDTASTTRAGLEGLFDFGRVTKRVSKRNLLNPDEILRLPHKNAILILRGQEPVLLEKMDYTTHPLAKKLQSRKIKDYKPTWSDSFRESRQLYQKPVIQPKTQTAYDLPEDDNYKEPEQKANMFW